MPSTSNAVYDDDVKTVKRAFRTQALRYHPDKVRSTTRDDDDDDGWNIEDAEREFQSLVDAYETVLTWTTTPGLMTCKERGEPPRGVGHRVWDATMDVVAGGWTRVKSVGEKVWVSIKSSTREKRRVVASKTDEDERDDEEEDEEDAASETSSKSTSNIRFRSRDGSMRDAFSAISDDTDATDDAYRLATRAFWARAKALLDDDDENDDAYVPDDDENDDDDDVVPIDDDEYPARFRSRV